MKVLFLSSEAAPYSKTGGLGDVAGSLPLALGHLGVEVFVFLPFYRTTQSQGLDIEVTGFGGAINVGGRIIEYSVKSAGERVFFIDCPELFDRSELYGTPAGEYADNPLRFSFFCRVVLEAAMLMDLNPDLVHANDWQTALTPLYMKSLYSKSYSTIPSLLTIHNLGYQGLFPPSAISITGLPDSFYHPGILEFYGHMNFLKAGIMMADAVNTVSSTYARQIQQPQWGFGLDGVLMDRADRLYGILNGLDYSEWNPESDDHIPFGFSSDSLAGKAKCKADFTVAARYDDPSRPLAGIVSRLAHQKGIDMIADAGRKMVDLGYNVAILGRGEPDLERRLEELSVACRGSFWLSAQYDEAAAHEIYAASDVFVMPSRYEPCGLSQLIAMRYGAIPVARGTGGIADTVEDLDHKGRGTGFVFDGEDAGALLECLKRALYVFEDRAQWDRLVRSAMSCDYSWRKSADAYLDLYRSLL